MNRPTLSRSTAGPSAGRWPAWRRFGRLPEDERRILLEALVVVPVVGVGLRWFGLRRLYRELDRTVPPVSQLAPDRQLPRSHTVAALVQSAARHCPIPTTCLSRSVALWWLLRRQGIPAELCIGVAKEAKDLRAHAWVELAGVVLNDSQEVRQRFAAFEGGPFAADVEQYRGPWQVTAGVGSGEACRDGKGGEPTGR